LTCQYRIHITVSSVISRIADSMLATTGKLRVDQHFVEDPFKTWERENFVVKHHKGKRQAKKSSQCDVSIPEPFQWARRPGASSTVQINAILEADRVARENKKTMGSVRRIRAPRRSYSPSRAPLPESHPQYNETSGVRYKPCLISDYDKRLSHSTSAPLAAGATGTSRMFESLSKLPDSTFRKIADIGPPPPLPAPRRAPSHPHLLSCPWDRADAEHVGDVAPGGARRRRAANAAGPEHRLRAQPVRQSAPLKSKPQAAAVEAWVWRPQFDRALCEPLGPDLPPRVARAPRGPQARRDPGAMRLEITASCLASLNGKHQSFPGEWRRKQQTRRNHPAWALLTRARAHAAGVRLANQHAARRRRLTMRITRCCVGWPCPSGSSTTVDATSTTGTR
jgi:hypothetical protein